MMKILSSCVLSVLFNKYIQNIKIKKAKRKKLEKLYVYTIKSKYMYILISRREIHAMKCKRKWMLNATNNKKKRKKSVLLVFEIATVAYLLFDQEIYLRTFFVLLSLCSSLLMLSRRNVHGNIITFASYTGKMPTLHKKILFFLFSSRYFLLFSCCFYNRK